MKRVLLIALAVGAIMVSGCDKEPTIMEPTIPEIFKTQLMTFLEEGAKTNAMASQGVSYMGLGEQVVNTKAAYDLLSSTWPATLAVDCRGDFENAIRGWDLTLDIWRLKLDKKDDPAEPDINGYTKYFRYAGDQLVVKVHGEDFIVESYRGKKYLPFDENISVLLTVAGSTFNQGRDKILSALQ